VGLAQLAPVDVAQLTEGVAGDDEDAAGRHPPGADAGGDPVLARTEAGRHGDVAMVEQGVGDPRWIDHGASSRMSVMKPTGSVR
jgi:hypothetical protein